MGDPELWIPTFDRTDDIAGVAKDTIYRWIEAKSPPAQRVGRLWKFKPSDAGRWGTDGMAAEDGAYISKKYR